MMPTPTHYGKHRARERTRLAAAREVARVRKKRQERAQRSAGLMDNAMKRGRRVPQPKAHHRASD